MSDNRALERLVTRLLNEVVATNVAERLSDGLAALRAMLAMQLPMHALDPGGFHGGLLTRRQQDRPRARRVPGAKGLNCRQRLPGLCVLGRRRVGIEAVGAV